MKLNAQLVAVESDTPFALTVRGMIYTTVRQTPLGKDTIIRVPLGGITTELDPNCTCISAFRLVLEFPRVHTCNRTRR